MKNIDLDMTQGIKRIIELLSKYNVKIAEDDPLIFLYIDLVTNEIKDICNISVLPQKLESVIVMRVVGSILEQKKYAAINSSEEMGPVKSQSIGDTSITFGETDFKLKDEVDRLKNYGMNTILSCRRLKW